MKEGVFLMGSSLTRFNPVFDQLLKWISEDQIGKLNIYMPLLVLMGQIDLMILDYLILKRVGEVYLI